jgi:hypothetical protein
MAEVTGLRNVALPYPVYGLPYGVSFPIYKNDGTVITGASGLDSERSLNGDTFADCTNEATEIATNSGFYYLLLTGAEMTADEVMVQVKSSSTGAVVTAFSFQPAKLVSLRAGTVGANAGDGTTLQLDSSASAVDDYYNGCLLVGTLDSNVEGRIISDYAGSTKVCTVSPAFVTTPDNNDTFVVYVPHGGRQFIQGDIAVSHWRGWQHRRGRHCECLVCQRCNHGLETSCRRNHGIAVRACDANQRGRFADQRGTGNRAGHC